MERQLEIEFDNDYKIGQNRENPEYLSKQLITYIGNKRNLLPFIDTGVQEVVRRLGRDKMTILDLFSGSGIVARFFKKYSKKLIVNDLELYSEIINRCYLANRSDFDTGELWSIYESVTSRLNSNPLKEGFIYEMYAPMDDTCITSGERVFYTTRNAKYIDTARSYIEEVEPSFRNFLLAPLLSEASIHANTAGVFKGFYKNTRTGNGIFGGSNGDALERIKGNIHLPFPLFSNFECDINVFREDAGKIAGRVNDIDLAYLDPPYNQHPYGSNYFMLNLIAEYKKPMKVSRVSGIPVDWNRSPFNRKREVSSAFSRIIEEVNAKFILVSFNSEGFISRKEMIDILKQNGKVRVYEQKYNTFRGSRNLGSRNIHVKEYLYLLEKK